MTIIQDLGLPGLPEALPRPVPDNHTHLKSTVEFSTLPPGESLDLAESVGVPAVVDVGYDLESSRHAIEWAQKDPRVVAAVALHPNDAARIYQRGGRMALNAELAELPELIEADGVRAVGETGLDYYRTREAEAQDAQALSFDIHIELAREFDRTLVIHDRDAHADILKVLDRHKPLDRVVMHCFSGEADFARECCSRGYWLSFPGVVTFGSADVLREAARATPAEKMLVETDAPYLTPAPARGKPNAPYLLPHTVRFLADLLDRDLAAFCDQVTGNTFAAYGGPWGRA